MDETEAHTDLQSTSGDENSQTLGEGCLPLERTTMAQSTVSHWTVCTIPKFPGKTMKLDKLVELIRSRPSLQRANILSTEGYKQIHSGVLHRFLILEVQREDRRSVWLRIDRRADPNMNRVSLLLARGESPAHDTVCPRVPF